MKKNVAVILSLLMVLMMAGCGGSSANKSGTTADNKETVISGESLGNSDETPEAESKSGDEKTVLKVGCWPTETNPTGLAQYEKRKEDFEALHPDIEIVPDTYGFAVTTFNAKAAAGQIPDLLANLPYTEAKSVIKNGYAADITSLAEKYGILDELNPDLVDLCSDEEGRLYTIPRVVYAQGLMMNKKLFAQAGLVNEDGTVMVPDTLDELAEFATTIKEKTGVAGFVLPTTNSQGGWILMNLAWNFGVEFEEQREDGTWQAVFDTPEFHKTLEWLYDLKWNRNVLADNTVVDANEMRMLLGSDQAGMIIGNTDWCSYLAKTCGMAVDNLAMAKMPAGPGGRYSQLGGSLFLFAPNLDEAQLDAAYQWIQFIGSGPEFNEEAFLDNCKVGAETGTFVFPPKAGFNIWNGEERISAMEKIAAPYVNVDMKDFENYNTDGVTLRLEPTVCGQELYSVLDGVIQEILTNKNVNIEEISKQAQEDFQVNHLDKID